MPTSWKGLPPVKLKSSNERTARGLAVTGMALASGTGITGPVAGGDVTASYADPVHCSTAPNGFAPFSISQWISEQRPRFRYTNFVAAAVPPPLTGLR
jgi:hypothetical protein